MICTERKSFWSDVRGTVTILGAVAIPLLMGFAALAVEYGAGLLHQEQNQRTADLASYIAATYCIANGNCGTTTTLATARSMANNIAALNGVPAASVTVSLGNSPASTTSQAVAVTIQTSQYLFLAPILGSGRTLSPTARSYAQLNASAVAAPCVLGLSASAALSLSGGVSLTAPSCGVATNNTVVVPCGTTLTASSVSYNTVAPTVGCSNMTPATATKMASTDPLATTSPVTTAEGRMSTVTAITSPSAPSVTVSAAAGGRAWPSSLTNLGWYPTTTVTDSSTGCTATWNSGSSAWTISGCASNTYNINSAIVSGPGMVFMPSGSSSAVYNFNYAVSTNYTTSSFGPGTYNFLQPVSAAGATTFGAVSSSGGTTTYGVGNFNFAQTLSTAGTTVFGAGNFNFVGSISLSGVTIFGASTAPSSNASPSTTTFASGSYTYNLNQGLSAGGGSTTAFGPGTFNIGAPSSTTCTNGYAYSICNTSTLLSFAGPSTFTTSKGVYSGGGTVLTMGSGSTGNSYQIGRSGDGNALNLTGGAVVTLGDATCAGCVFQLNGNLVDGGGRCTLISASAQHDINGSMNLQGGTVLGTGVYTVAGYFGAGISSGGAVTCTIPNYNGGGSSSSQSVGVYGYGVTVAYGANAIAYTDSSRNAYGFYVGAGFTNFTLVAPTSSTAGTQNLAVAGPMAGGTAAGIFLGAGASNTTISGALYTPTGPFSMSGGASVVNGAGACLEIVAQTISLSGGAAAASTCITGTGGTNSSGTTVSIVK
ncbi:Tad domain-containing protein [Methylocystis heyeri]|uniref:Putative Flp pilus-assembly TadG-like N-terminal domain-containing protein n=1 Tax=Methylocystis heyeri TaxID=391905 RepID=A0A6B8KHG3_9HYPH|nr:Tad domain-containing protein [Methylocystis heyeri]QGM45943.1 hypothetical protein H2LOC_009635 [Methylocystis heyeri]